MRPPASKGKGFGRGRGRGFGGRGGRGGGGKDFGPPARVEAVGTVMHSCEGDIVCKLTHSMVPYFNAFIYVDKDKRVGKVDEILGPINEVMFTVKPEDGATASSFQTGDVLCIDPMKLLPMARFTSPSGGGGSRGGKGKGKGGGRGKGKGGRGKGGKGRGRGGKGGGRGRGRGKY